jgi:hypothetical protein
MLVRIPTLLYLRIHLVHSCCHYMGPYFLIRLADLALGKTALGLTSAQFNSALLCQSSTSHIVIILVQASSIWLKRYLTRPQNSYYFVQLNLGSHFLDS